MRYDFNTIRSKAFGKVSRLRGLVAASKLRYEQTPEFAEYSRHNQTACPENVIPLMEWWRKRDDLWLTVKNTTAYRAFASLSGKYRKAKSRLDELDRVMFTQAEYGSIMDEGERT